MIARDIKTAGTTNKNYEKKHKRYMKMHTIFSIRLGKKDNGNARVTNPLPFSMLKI